MIEINKAKQIIECRKQAKLNDSLKLQKQRNNWLDKLSEFDSKGFNKKETIPGMESRYGDFDKRIVYCVGYKTAEIYNINGTILKGKLQSYNSFNCKHNTRTKLNSETCLEIDKLPFEKSFKIMLEVISSLIRNNYHFAIFYAKGQRSLHIRIYDFEEMQDLNPKQRIKAQILFWQKQVPFGCFQYVDTGMFVDEHTMQLEFAPHWKYRTCFNLILEYPSEEKCKG